MRSSIACARCRRSKIKCVNNGTNTVCVPCHQNNRECTYPTPAVSTSSATKRSEHPSGAKNDGDGEHKRARKREPDSGPKFIHRADDDPLNTPPINLKLWREIYSLFILHYSTELPFLHEATFFDRIKQMQESGTRSRETQIFLLGMLSLTARFVPQLVEYAYPREAHHQQSRLRSGDPLNASEFYARALEARLDAITMATPSLDTIQALLMLGLYNWGMCRGMRSWMWVGNATRMAYAMGLSEEDPDGFGKLHPVSSEEADLLGVKRKLVEPVPKLDSQGYVAREIKRRIMWGCFILDRYLSCGRARPQMIAEQLQIQLPCSEEDFRFGTNVKTESLYPSGDISRLQSAANGGVHPQITTCPVLGIYIRLVEIWGRFSKWSCAGGRRKEIHPPWDHRSEFHNLRKRLDNFQDSLPPRLTFNPVNLAAHVGGTAMTVYTAIHTLYSLCEIVLHREYIPFIALRCDSPIGPLDEPVFPKEKYDIPKGFWEDSAAGIFLAAKNIMEIVQANSERGFFIESPQIGFAVWTAAFVGVYSLNFPHMDTTGYMNRKESTHVDLSHPVETVKGATGLAVRTLNQMSPRMKMAYGWSKTIKRMHEYFNGIIKDYNQSTLSPTYTQDPGSLVDSRRLSLREGGGGGGLEEYKLLEKELKEFGNIEEDERHSTPTPSDRTGSRASTSGPGMTPHLKVEATHGSERPLMAKLSTAQTWAAVNTTKPIGGDSYGRPLSYSLFSQSSPPGANSTTAQEPSFYPHSSQQPKGPTSNSSSLVSPQAPNLSPSYSAAADLVNMHRSDETYHAASLQQSSQFSTSGHRVQHNHSHPSWLPPHEANQQQQDQPEIGFFKSNPRVVLGGAQVAGFSDGLPYDMWAPDGDASLTETNFMQAIWHGQPESFYST